MSNHLQLENIKSHLSKYDLYEVFDSDDMNAEEVIRSDVIIVMLSIIAGVKMKNVQ